MRPQAGRYALSECLCPDGLAMPTAALYSGGLKMVSCPVSMTSLVQGLACSPNVLTGDPSRQRKVQVTDGLSLHAMPSFAHVSIPRMLEVKLQADVLNDMDLAPEFICIDASLGKAPTRNRCIMDEGQLFIVHMAVHTLLQPEIARVNKMQCNVAITSDYAGTAIDGLPV